MRAIILVLFLAHSAAAAPDRQCYAGTLKIDGSERRALVVWETDAAAIRIRTRDEVAPWREGIATYHVATDGASVTLDAVVGSKGKLVGPRGKWSGLHLASDAGAAITTDLERSGDALREHTSVQYRGRTVNDITIDATRFDCAELEQRRAALDGSGKNATHACFAGTQVTPMGEHRPVVVEQILEPTRVRIAETFATTDDVIVFAVTSTGITARNLARSWQAEASLTGKPGAWNAYSYHADDTDQRIKVNGTLGGKHVHEVSAVRAQSSTLDADSFDCKDLESRRAALSH